MLDTDFRVYIFYAILYGIFLLLGEGIFRLLKVHPAWSRNFAHMAAGLSSLAFPWLFTTHWWVLGISLHSIVFLTATRRLGLLGSHHSTAGRSMGSYLFFLSLYLCFLVYELSGELLLFLAPVLVLSLADPAAAIIGRYFGKSALPGLQIGRLRLHAPEAKTREGSLAFFLVSFLCQALCWIFIAGLTAGLSIMLALPAAAILTLAEALSRRGSDNFFIPFICLIFCALVLYI